MAKRIYIRTIFNNIFKKNIIVNVLGKIVNFYCNLWFKSPNSIKFNKDMSINMLERDRQLFFLSVTGDKIDCK